jgi:DNA transformation protein
MPHDDFIAYLHELLEPAGKVSARAMFGGWGIYVDGTIIGIVVDRRLYLKVDALSQTRFAATGSAPFMYQSPKGPMAMSYWSIPDDAMDSSEAMAPWARLAKDAAGRKALATKPKSSANREQAKPKPKSLTSADVSIKPKRPAARSRRDKQP